MVNFFPNSINKSAHHIIFFIGISFLFAIALYEYANTDIGLITYATSDWLINYQGGMVRRGLIGQLIFSLTSEYSNMLLLLFCIQIIVALVTLWLVLKLFFSSEKTTSWLLFLLSPAFFISYFLYETHSAIRKENLVFLAMALLANGLSGRGIKSIYLFAAVATYSIAVLSHEIACFCLPFFLYPLWITYRNRANHSSLLLKIAISFCAASILGLIFSIIFKGDSLVAEKICTSLVQRGFDKILCEYSIPFLASNTFDAHQYLLTQVSQKPYIPLYSICLLLSAIPFLLSSWIKLRTTQLLVGSGALALLPLFLTAIDWGRWVHVYVVLITICLFWYATQEPIKVKKISLWLVFGFISLWTLPASITAGKSVAHPQIFFLPNFGLVDVAYRQWKDEPRASTVENMPKTLFKKYKKVIFYPLEKNSPSQHRFSLLALKNGASSNASIGNLIGQARFLNLHSSNFIEIENQKNKAALIEGRIDPDSLYIFPKKDMALGMLLPILRPNQDVLFSDSNNLVLAPNWKTCVNCSPHSIPNSYDLGLLQSGENKNEFISFAASSRGKNPLLISGWYDFSEDWGTWSVAPHAKVFLPVPRDKPKTITFQARAFIMGPPGVQSIQITLNGVPQKPLVLQNFEKNIITINLPPEALNQQYLDIDFDIPNLRSPFNLGIGDDRRLLGIGLKSAVFQ